MIDLDDPDVRRHVEQKRRLRERASTASTRASTATREVAGAPNQRAVKNWIKLDLGRPVPATHDPWTRGDAFEIAFECESTGRVARVTIGALKRANGGSWSDFDARDWHCVTGWSARGIDFKGVTLDVALRAAFPEGVASQWTCLYQISADGYTVGVDARDVTGAFLAVEDGNAAMLSKDHGGPRLVFPTVYGWKSAKYLTRVRLLRRYEDGFWERLGCHRRGRWALEERRYIICMWCMTNTI